MPRVSIIMAMYNHERFVSRAIESALEQTFSDWELLIWDDGSSDRSLELAERLVARDPRRLRLFQHPGGKNLGQEVTRNAAIARASGEFLCLLDSDDYFYPRRLEALVPFFSDQKVGLAYGRSEIRIESTGALVPTGMRLSPSGQVLKPLVHENFVSGNAVLFRRECFDSCGGFDSRYRTIGEYPLWIRIARDWHFAHAPETLAVWRDHGFNQSTKLALESRRELLALCERLLADESFSEVRADLEAALAKRRYDLASELFFALAGAGGRELREVRELSLQVLGQRSAGRAVRAKAAFLAMAAMGGKRARGLAAGVKRKLWELRNPVASLPGRVRSAVRSSESE